MELVMTILRLIVLSHSMYIDNYSLSLCLNTAGLRQSSDNTFSGVLESRGNFVSKTVGTLGKYVLSKLLFSVILYECKMLS